MPKPNPRALGRLLVAPTTAPKSLLVRLAEIGLARTDLVHEAILSGTLEDRPGIGPATVERILEHFTDPPPGRGGPRANSGRPAIGGKTIEARLLEPQLEVPLKRSR